MCLSRSQDGGDSKVMKNLLKQLGTILSYAAALIFIGMCLGIGFMDGTPFFLKAFSMARQPLF